MKDALRTLKFTHGYMLPHLRTMILAQLVMLASMLLTIGIPMIIRQAIDYGVLNDDPRLLLGSAGLVLAVGLVSVGLLNFGKRLRFGVAGRTVGRLRHDLMAHLLRLGPVEATEASGGQALARLTSDSSAMRAVVNGGLVEIVNQFLLAVALLVTCLILDWRVTLLSIIPLVPVAIMTLRIQVRLQTVFNEIRSHFASLLSGVVESLANTPVIKAFGHEPQASEKLSGINEALAQKRRRLRMTYSTHSAFYNVISALPTPIALWVGAGAVVDGELTVGALVALIALIMMLQMSVHMLTMDTNGVLHGIVNGKRLLKLLDTRPAVRVESETIPVPRLTGRLTAQGLRAELGDRVLLDGIDLSVAPGEFVALVGPTGGGKSFLLHLLARLRDPSGGVVSYDGHDARRFDPEELHRQVVCLPQQQWIFEGTLADNIRFVRPDATTEEVSRAVIRAGIGHIPLDRELAAGSKDLSAGERQRVGLARALLVDPPILLLDNPTANLDAETEARFAETLLELRGSRTMIVATQHEALARHADRVLTLDAGRLHIDVGSLAHG